MIGTILFAYNAIAFFKKYFGDCSPGHLASQHFSSSRLCKPTPQKFGKHINTTETVQGSAEGLCIKLGWKCLWHLCFKKVWQPGTLSFLAFCQVHSSLLASSAFTLATSLVFQVPVASPTYPYQAVLLSRPPQHWERWGHDSTLGLFPLVPACLVTWQTMPFFSLPIFLAEVLPWGVLYTFNRKFCSSTPFHISVWEFNFFM